MYITTLMIVAFHLIFNLQNKESIKRDLIVSHGL